MFFAFTFCGFNCGQSAGGAQILAVYI